MEKFTYGAHEIDFDSLPDASKVAIVGRGLTHVFGNEVASRVHSWAMGETQANSDDKAVVKAWKDSNATAISTQAAVVALTMYDALVAGTLGNRASGPRVTPLDAMRRKIAKGQIENILRAHKIKVPTKDDKVKMPDGEFSMAELIDRRLVLVTKDGTDIGAQITKEAEKKIAAEAKANAAAAEQGLDQL